MKNLLILSSLVASAVIPSTAHAQALSPAVIAVVDLDKVTADCTACKTALAALRAQGQAYQSRESALAAPLQTEQQSLQTAVNALNGKEPDAALKARITAFQNKQQQGATELQRQQQQLQRNQQYVQKQIADKLGPIYSQVMQRRGATIMLEQGATLATAQSIDVTNDVLAALNTAMPTIQTTAPAAPATSTTQGR